VDPGPISIILLSPVYFSRTVYFTRILYCFPFDTLITFVSSKPVRLTTSSQVGNEVLGCVVCRFRVAACKRSLDEAPYINCPKLSQTSKHHLQSFVSPLQERLNLGFLTEGKLAAILITPSSWGSQRAGYLPCTRTVCYASTWHQQPLFWRHCREGSRRLLRGEFSHAHPLLCFIVLLYFIYFTCIVLYQKTQKN
jgi:hypothetical protein